MKSRTLLIRWHLTRWYMNKMADIFADDNFNAFSLKKVSCILIQICLKRVLNVNASIGHMSALVRVMAWPRTVAPFTNMV